VCIVETLNIIIVNYLIIDIEDNSISWFENIDGLGTFSERRIITSNAIDANTVFAADLNNDGTHAHLYIHQHTHTHCCVCESHISCIHTSYIIHHTSYIIHHTSNTDTMTENSTALFARFHFRLNNQNSNKNTPSTPPNCREISNAPSEVGLQDAEPSLLLFPA